jgi:hypothetical protein
MDSILQLANASKAKERIILLDCCHSGLFGTPVVTGSETAQLTEGMVVLTASRGSEVALESNGAGIFTSLVTEALNGGAADLSGNITPGSVYAFVDQALGAWDQRPIFKTNVSNFTSLRSVKPHIPLGTLRNLSKYFPSSDFIFKLEPSFEDTTESPNPINVAIFKDLQKYQSGRLVVPVNEEYMYYAAINAGSCKLTSLGVHYWRLAKEGKI